MDRELQASMRDYYDARASEYDEIYTGGILPGTSADGRIYAADARALMDVVRRRCAGSILDAPCGTAFWLPAYASRATRVRLIDQSASMLREARFRARASGVDAACSFSQQEVLDCIWADQACDTLLCGFFLSHVDRQQEARFFAGARRALGTQGELLVLDSCWTEERGQTRPKEGRQRRTLKDGRQFDIYKRYFDEPAVYALATRYRLAVKLEFSGRAFLAFSARFAASASVHHVL